MFQVVYLEHSVMGCHVFTKSLATLNFDIIGNTKTTTIKPIWFVYSINFLLDKLPKKLKIFYPFPYCRKLLKLFLKFKPKHQITH